MAKSFMSRKGREFEITFEDQSTETVTFYPISVRRLSLMQDMVKALAKAIMTLTGGNVFDEMISTSRESISSDFKETISEPVSVEESAKRIKMKEASLDDLFNVILHETNLITVAELLIDSLRDDAPTKDPQEFLDQTEIGLLPQLLQGFAQANQKVLPGPLRKRVQAAWKQAVDRLSLEDPIGEATKLSLSEEESFETSSESLPESEAASESPAPTESNFTAL